MSKFLLKSFIFILLVLVIVLSALLFIPNKKIVNNSLFASIDKHNRLEQLSSPKLIFVGGSNLGFGIDSEKIEKELGIPVVNMGLHAGLGIRYMINEVKPSINKNDIVVISLEYEHFVSDEMANGEKVLMALLVDVNRNNIRYIPFSQWYYLFPLGFEYGVSKLFRNQIDIMDDDDVESYTKHFNRNSFNKYGDEVMHYDYPNEKFDSNETSVVVYPTNDAFGYIKDFYHFLDQKGATLYLLPPVLMKSLACKKQDMIVVIEKILREQKTPFLSSAKTFFYEDSLFFNTPYHLNKKGVDIRTNKIIDVLNSKMNLDGKARR